MDKREMIVTLQTNLMKLAQAFIEKKGYNILLVADKKEFSIYNELFIALITKLPYDFYFDESDNKYIDEIIELSNNINSKIETLNGTKK